MVNIIKLLHYSCAPLTGFWCIFWGIKDTAWWLDEMSQRKKTKYSQNCSAEHTVAIQCFNSHPALKTYCEQSIYSWFNLYSKSRLITVQITESSVTEIFFQECSLFLVWPIASLTTDRLKNCPFYLKTYLLLPTQWSNFDHVGSTVHLWHYWPSIL